METYFSKMKTEIAQVNYQRMTVNTTMNVVRDEINENIDGSMFELN